MNFPTRNSERKIVYKYYTYQSSVTFGFFWPIFTIFLLSRGLSFTQITLLNSFSAAFIVIGEIPTGFIADRIGRRNSMVASSLFYTASIAGFALVESFYGFLFLWLLWSFARTFQSGSADAWLYDTLEERLDEEEYTKVRGRGGSVNMWVSAGTMLTAGVLYSFEPVLPFVMGGLLNGLGVLVLLSMPKTKAYSGDNESDDDGYTIFDALPVIKNSLSKPPLRSFVLYFALFFGIVTVVDNFIQPIIVSNVGFPESSLGPIYAGFSAVGAIGSYYASTIEEKLSTRGAILLLPFVVSIFLVVPLLFPLVALPAFFLMKGTRQLLYPIMSGYVNEQIGSMERATLLSAISMVYALFRIPLQPIGGYVAEVTSPVIAVASLVGLFVAGAVLLHVWEPPAVSASNRKTEIAD